MIDINKKYRTRNGHKEPTMSGFSKTQPKRVKKTIYINIGKDDVYVEAFTIKKAADYWANFRVQKPAARLTVEVEYTEGEGVGD